MKEECLICQAPLEYLGTETLMECALCHRQEMSQTALHQRTLCLQRMPYEGNGCRHRLLPE